MHRGPNVMMGYYKDPEATAEARKFGWHHTGDLALIDEHGEVLFLDRKKDMIKSGGENVASEDRGDAAGPSRCAKCRGGRPAASAMGRGGVGLRQAGSPVLRPTKLESPNTAASLSAVFKVPKLVRILEEMP